MIFQVFRSHGNIFTVYATDDLLHRFVVFLPQFEIPALVCHIFAPISNP